jgi:plastocyanin
MMGEGRGPLVDERPSADEEPAEEPRRPLPPLVYPLVAVLFGGALVWGFSRVLLAVGKYQAVAIAILMALNILVGAALIAYGSRVRRRPAALPFLIVAGVAIIGIGLVANFAYGDKGPEKKKVVAAGASQTVGVTAQGLKFSPTSLKLAAGVRATINFDNKDASTQHNIVIFKGTSASGQQVFRGTVITGPSVIQYPVPPLAPGPYFFHCEIHTTMTGSIAVAAGPGAAPTVTAQNTAFSPATLKVTPSGGKVDIHFVNKDASVQHNIVVFGGKDATAPQLFSGQLVTGPGSVDYSFTAPPSGTYFFHCLVHPTQMTGTITIS